MKTVQKFFLAIVVAVLAISNLAAQVEIDIQDAVSAYFDAKLCEDYETLVGFTYPDVVEKAGGEDKVRKAIVHIHESQKKKGFVLQQYKTMPVLQHAKVGEELHAIVPVTTISKVPGGKVFNEISVIVVGTNDLQRWYVIETTSLDEMNVSKVLANWDETMIIPYKKAPVFKEDKKF